MLNSIIEKYKRSPLIQRFAGGTVWSFLAGLVNNLVFLLIGLILSHMLGKYLYGQYGMVRSTINMFIAFSSFALGTTTTKYVAQYRFVDKQKTERIINLSLFVASLLALTVFIICLISANYIALQTLHTPSLTVPVRIASWMVLFLTISGVVNGVLIGYEEFFLIFKQNLISACLLIVCSTLCSWLFKLNGALIGLLVYLFAFMYLGMYYLCKIYKREGLRFSFREIGKELTILWRFSLPATLGGLVYTPVIWLTNTILVNSPAGYGAMAGLDIIRQWYSAVLFIPTIAGRVVLPMLSNLCNQTESRSYNKVLMYSLFVNVGTAILIGLLLYLFSPILFSMYGTVFSDLKHPFGIMLIVAVIFVGNSIVGQIILSKNYAWWGFLFNSIWATVFIFLNIYFVKNHTMGILGVTFSYLISYLLHSIVQIIFCCFILKK